ncbi:glutamate receptor 2.7-like [Cornus florida]|uniref:glutamate receptor 2.7-like n=1 Tax=Cornus florida TaxID=4283 RepID=UPI0028A0BE32|nr:glutamate receptor 2.7-like [Cornus florida]
MFDAAEELIKEKKVQVIIGMETWEEAALVADIGTRTQFPVLSFAAAAITSELVRLRWPFLVQMVTNGYEQINCIADIVQSFKWQSVVAVYEEDIHGGDSGKLTMLSKALKKVGSTDIDYHLVLPPFSDLSEPDQENFVNKELSSPPVVFAMEGALVIKPYYSENSDSFKDFSEQFCQKFQSAYPEEDKSEPGIHALRAYDSIMTLTQYSEHCQSGIQKPWLLVIRVQFLGGTKKIDNVEKLAGFAEVIWPGNPERIPGGLAPMKIAVPGRVSFKKFLNAEWNENTDEKYFTGFCISLYKEVQTILKRRYNIHLPSPNEFQEYDGSYNDLVESVHNKTFDAAVGDITIIAKRWSLVEFTEPFMESGLSMVVPVKSVASKVWLFQKPFTMEMWVATGIIFIYTVLVVWFLEQRSTPEFSGPWREQLSNVLWFTFSTRSILCSHYTASLTSMLTFSRLRPTVTDIEWLQRTNVRVGCACYGRTFVRNYLKHVYKFKPKNIIHIRNQSEYLRAFENGNISAAFLEVPYAKVFVNQYCNRSSKKVLD